MSANIYHNRSVVLYTMESYERMISLMVNNERANWKADRPEAKKQMKKRGKFNPLMLIPLALAAGVTMTFFVIRRRIAR